MINLLKEKNYQRSAENYAWQMAESIAKVGLEQQCLIWQSLEKSSEKSFEFLNYPWDNSANCYQAFHKASIPELQMLLKVINKRLKNVDIVGDSQTFFWTIKDFLDAYLFSSMPQRSGEYQEEFLSVLSKIRDSTLKRILAPLIKELPKVAKTKSIQALFAALVSQKSVVETAKVCSQEELVGLSETLQAKLKMPDELEKSDIKVLTLLNRLINAIITEMAHA